MECQINYVMKIVGWLKLAAQELFCVVFFLLLTCYLDQEENLAGDVKNNLVSSLFPVLLPIVTFPHRLEFKIAVSQWG